MWRLTDEQRERRERIREFALEEVRPRMLEIDDTCDYPFDVHDALRREQLIGLAIPEEYGGAGANSVTFCSYIEELAKVSATASLMAAYRIQPEESSPPAPNGRFELHMMPN